ncbi:MAG: sugar porter family MFS transporter [Prolixibacteraceae bacterium]|jgi:sugar porter (SP) family MFS transporter|nr:sugar porter family MFS transporter [Prolixibacteraceae bacterium]
MINKKEFNFRTILSISLISAMGGLLFGYDWVVIGGAEPFYKIFFDIADSPRLQGLAMGSALPGCLVGAILAGFLSELVGRKKSLLIASLLFTMSAIGVGYSGSLGVFIIFRLIGGFGIGIASVVSPIYIAEVTPGEYRGRFVSLNQLTIVIGILAAQLMNFLIAEKVPEGASDEFIRNSWNGQMGWRWMFWVMTVPSTVFFVLALVLPESPRWLTKKNEPEKALKILSRIGGAGWAVEQLAGIRQTFDNNGDEKVNLRALLSRNVFPVIVLGIVLAIFQQWCGINIIFNYAADIFRSAGFSVSDALFNIVITGTFNLVFTFVAMATVDRLGRRKLMIIGSAGLAVIYILLGGSFYYHYSGIVTLVLILTGISVYAMTLAPVTWVILSEIFPNKVRGAAMAVATSFLWIASFIIVYTYPMLKRAFDAHGTFCIYALICVAGCIFICKKLPETKGKTLEELETELLK